jgi:hypothetical protein
VELVETLAEGVAFDGKEDDLGAQFGAAKMRTRIGSPERPGGRKLGGRVA